MYFIWYLDAAAVRVGYVLGACLDCVVYVGVAYDYVVRVAGLLEGKSRCPHSASGVHLGGVICDVVSGFAADRGRVSGLPDSLVLRHDRAHGSAPDTHPLLVHGPRYRVRMAAAGLRVVVCARAAPGWRAHS